MSHRCRSTKRPCRICRKWFRPDPRLGDRQKTCGAPECQRGWHARKCAEWNRKNRTYFQEVYLSARLRQVAPANLDADTNPAPKVSPSVRLPPPDSRQFPRLPRSLVQEVIGAQQLVIIDYLARLLFRSLQEVISLQRAESTEEYRQVLPAGPSRGDSLGRGP